MPLDNNTITKITNGKLITLDLHTINPARGICIDGAKALAIALQHVNSRLTHISLWGQEIEDDGIAAIENALPNSHVASINLDHNKMGSTGTKKILSALRHPNTKVISLGIAGNRIEDSETLELARILTEPNCRITSLSLAANDFTDQGAKAIADALKKHHCKLAWLNLQNIRKLTEKGKAIIVKAIKSNDSLLYFCMAIPTGPLFKQMLHGLAKNRASFVNKCNRILAGQHVTLWDKEKTFLQCHSIIDVVQSKADVMLPKQEMEDLANLCIPKLQLEYDALLTNNLMLSMPQPLSNIVMEYVREDNPLWYVYFSNGTTQNAYDIGHHNENSDSVHADSQNNDGGAQDSMSTATPEQHDSNPEADQDLELDSYYQFQQEDPTEGSYIENLLTTIFTWIKDLPEDLQQRIFSSVMEQLYKMLESIEQPNKAVTDQLNSEPIEKIFEIDHSEYHNQNGFISSSQQYAQPYKSDHLISMDILLGPALSSGIFMEPLSKDIDFSAPHFFSSMAS